MSLPASQGKAKVASLDISYPAVPASVGEARVAVASLAALAGADEETTDRVRLAVSEAVSNAVMHAYESDAVGSVHIVAAVIDGELSIVVADDGCCLGRARESPGLGLGMALMAQMCDSLTITSSGGTQVEMRLRLTQACLCGQDPCTPVQDQKAPEGEASRKQESDVGSPGKSSAAGPAKR